MQNNMIYFILFIYSTSDVYVIHNSFYLLLNVDKFSSILISNSFVLFTVTNNDLQRGQWNDEMNQYKLTCYLYVFA